VGPGVDRDQLTLLGRRGEGSMGDEAIVIGTRYDGWSRWSPASRSARAGHLGRMAPHDYQCRRGYDALPYGPWSWLDEFTRNSDHLTDSMADCL
jgi:hypothetical protein